MPKVSVVMPAYNAELYIGEAIDSILSQTLNDLELIIIDDGSTDNTADIIKSYNDSRIIYLKNDRNMKISDTLNRGIAIAKGKFIARMDSDDIAMPDRLQKQVEFMEKNPEITVCGTNTIVFGAQSTSWPSSPTHNELRVDALFNCCLAHPTVMFSSDLIKSGELRYNPDFNGAEDYELWTRLMPKHQFACMQEELLKYRIHSSQTTKNQNTDYLNKLIFIKKRLLDELKLKYTDTQLDSFVKYSAGASLSTIEEQSFIRLLLNILKKNKETKIYDSKHLLSSIHAVLMRCHTAKKTKRVFLIKNIKYYLSPLGLYLFLRGLL